LEQYCVFGFACTLGFDFCARGAARCCWVQSTCGALACTKKLRRARFDRGNTSPHFFWKSARCAHSARPSNRHCTLPSPEAPLAWPAAKLSSPPALQTYWPSFQAKFRPSLLLPEARCRFESKSDALFLIRSKSFGAGSQQDTYLLAFSRPRNSTSASRTTLGEPQVTEVTVTPETAATVREPR